LTPVGSGTGAVILRQLLGRFQGFPFRARVEVAVIPFPVPAASHAACGFYRTTRSCIASRQGLWGPSWCSQLLAAVSATAAHCLCTRRPILLSAHVAASTNALGDPSNPRHGDVARVPARSHRKARGPGPAARDGLGSASTWYRLARGFWREPGRRFGQRGSVLFCSGFRAVSAVSVGVVLWRPVQLVSRCLSDPVASSRWNLGRELGHNVAAVLTAIAPRSC